YAGETRNLGVLSLRSSTRARLVLVVPGLRMLHSSLSSARDHTQAKERTGSVRSVLVLRVGVCRVLVVVACAHNLLRRAELPGRISPTQSGQAQDPDSVCNSPWPRSLRPLHVFVSTVAGVRGLSLPCSLLRAVHPRQTLSGLQAANKHEVDMHSRR